MGSDPTTRVLTLLSLLQSNRFWPGAELADRLGVSARTLRRDIDRLRSIGYEVDASSGVAGGYRMAAGANLPPLLLDDDEAVAMAVGLRAAAGAAIDGIEDTAVRAMVKLEQVLPDRLRRRVGALRDSISEMGWPSDGVRVDPAALALLAQACRDHEQVRFEYRRRDGDEARRLVEPHHLVSAGRRWYLVAWDVRRGDWRTFRVDRMTEPELGGVRFRPRTVPGGDPAAFVAASMDAMPLAHEASVLVDAEPTAVAEVVRWAEVARADGGRSRVRFRSESEQWLDLSVALLARHFDVTVEEPAEMATRLTALADRLRAAAAR